MYSVESIATRKTPNLTYPKSCYLTCAQLKGSDENLSIHSFLFCVNLVSALRVPIQRAVNILSDSYPIHPCDTALLGLFARLTHISHSVPILISLRNLHECKLTYHVMTANPSKADRILKVIATIPLGVNPAGSGPGATFAPAKFKKSTVFAAALPA